MKTKNLLSAVFGTILKVVLAVAVVMIIYKGAVFGYDYGYRVFAETPVAVDEGRTVTVAITEGMSPQEIGEMMYSKGLVREARLFAIQYMLSEFRSDVKPGIYDLSTSMTPEEMMESMARQGQANEESAGDGEGNSRRSADEDTGTGGEDGGDDAGTGGEDGGDDTGAGGEE